VNVPALAADQLIQGELHEPIPGVPDEARIWFWLTVVTVNWGRGYDPGEFRKNVRNVLDFTEGREHVALLVQELDEEPDLSHEHRRFGSMLEPGTHKVAWPHREPIILSPPMVPSRERIKLTMGAGGEIGGPRGTGPRRFAITTRATIRIRNEDISVGFGNTHPHRSMPGSRRVQAARSKGQQIFQNELISLWRSHQGTSVIWGADMNDREVPRLIPGEKVAIHKGLDHLRYAPHPHGANLKLLRTGRLEGTIDPHDPLWAKFLVWV
jgi:hypothetical protein